MSQINKIVILYVTKNIEALTPNDYSAKKAAIQMKTNCFFNIIEINKCKKPFFREACKNETCSKLCIKSELGDDGNKLGS